MRIQTNRDDSAYLLDNHATTPTDPRVVEAMAPWWSEHFGNPHSGDHWYGWSANQAVDNARSKLAKLIGAEPDEIIFTSGATEANNLAILGAAQARRPHRSHIVVSAIEHKCVLESAAQLERDGFLVDIVPVDGDGQVQLDVLEALLTENTALVSIMAVNNEIGSIQPIAEVSRLCLSVDAWLHCDAAQAPAAIDVDVSSLGIDFMSLSSHKMYGPMGIGALYGRADLLHRLRPITYGGGQEQGLRSGTVPTPLCVGFGEAAKLISKLARDERPLLAELRDTLWQGIETMVPSAALNGGILARHPGNLNILFPTLDASALIGALQPHLAISTGSACTTGIPEPSHVLTAIGLSQENAECSVRFGIGRFTSGHESTASACVARHDYRTPRSSRRLVEGLTLNNSTC